MEYLYCCILDAANRLKFTRSDPKNFDWVIKKVSSTSSTTSANRFRQPSHTSFPVHDCHDALDASAAYLQKKVSSHQVSDRKDRFQWIYAPLEEVLEHLLAMIGRIVRLREVTFQVVAVLQKGQSECLETDPTASQSIEQMLPSFAYGILRVGVMQDPHDHQLDALECCSVTIEEAHEVFMAYHQEATQA
ncbi:hypothetical protein HO173_006590 [Letharia columbiana]|uniref:Uncharacterized protein n=1 Tax=Letharia columbiana TaxID=112416 RepID=A0A8H6L4P4_9LECA|nr:uncharacterized protein HO173_006590 [Letharia columbiana]KAF6235394.1 hypothetical protein HO173_006590 [Letharia columbiana]